MNKSLYFIPKDTIKSIVVTDRSVFSEYYPEVKGILGTSIGRKKAGFGYNRQSLEEFINAYNYSKHEYERPYMLIKGVLYKRVRIRIHILKESEYKCLYYDTYEEALAVINEYQQLGVLESMINIIRY